MLSKEFRIGNYYYDIDNKLSEMSGYELHQLTIKENTDNLGYCEYEPIVLSEKLLIDLGFKRDLGCIYVRNFIELREDNDKYIVWFNSGYITDIKYVHELQNIYKLIINEELVLSCS